MRLHEGYKEIKKAQKLIEDPKMDEQFHIN